MAQTCCKKEINRATYEGDKGPVTYCKKCGRTGKDTA
jgi:hypothetical protein